MQVLTKLKTWWTKECNNWSRKRFCNEYVPGLFAILWDCAKFDYSASNNMHFNQNTYKIGYPERFTQLFYDPYLSKDISKPIVNSNELKEIIRDFYKFNKLSVTNEQIRKSADILMERFNESLPFLFGEKCNP